MATPTQAPPRPAGTSTVPQGNASAYLVGRFRDWFGERAAALDTPAGSYYMILGSTLSLTVFGLVMVLSSSSVDMLDSGASPFSQFLRQAGFALIGVPLMFAASRIPPSWMRRMAWPILVGGAAFQLLVFTPLGYRVNGNLNWIKIGPLTGQPSELVKIALIIWIASVLATKGRLVKRISHALFPVAIGAGLLIGLVLLGHDMGTASIMVLVVAAMLFAAGVRKRLFLFGFGLAALAVIPLVATQSSRAARVLSWIRGDCNDIANVTGVCWQSTRAQFALGSGGWFGLGLGESREKWSYLPEAHNDFIFAVIGEELGLIGSFVVLALFVALTFGLLRVVQRHTDPFTKLATIGIMAWVIGQALVNIAVVLGMLPVLGVPLPLVSSGGSALLMVLIACGIALSFARHEPGAREALAARAGRKWWQG